MNKTNAGYAAIFLLTVLMAEVLGRTDWLVNGRACLLLLLALGMALAITGCFYYSRESRADEESEAVLPAFCLILFLTTLFRAADFMADPLDYDSYASISGKRK